MSAFCITCTNAVYDGNYYYYYYNYVRIGGPYYGWMDGMYCNCFFRTHQEQCLSETTGEHLARSVCLSQSNAFSNQLEGKCYFELSTSEWDCVLSQDCVNPSWVHVMARGLSKINSCCSFAFRRHWRKIHHSQKSGSVIFKAGGY